MRKLVVFAFLHALPGSAVAAEDLGDPKARATTATSSSATSDAAVSASASSKSEHANPRMKLSYRGFGISGLDGGTVGLKGGQLDVYPVSRRFFRLGIEAEAGAGDATMSGGNASLWYGMGGLTAGFQYPARVTPFVEGRFAAGALGGTWSGTVGQSAGQAITVSNASATTFMYVGGIDAGIELYAISRLYISASVGWAHPVYTGIDFAAMQADPNGGMKLRQISADTFTFKLGIGI